MNAELQSKIENELNNNPQDLMNHAHAAQQLVRNNTVGAGFYEQGNNFI